MFDDGRERAYKRKAVCFTCRKSWKRRHRRLFQGPGFVGAQHQDAHAKCPSCAGPIVNPGIAFRAPSRFRKRKWAALEEQYLAGKRWRSSTQ